MSIHSTVSKVEYKSLAFLGYDKYRVGDDGSVWSCSYNRWGIGEWRLKKQTVTPDKRKIVQLWADNKGRLFLVHRLVLLAFVGPCPEGQECCHEDGNPFNNYLDNLRWDTDKENQADRIRHGRSTRGRTGNSHKMRGRISQMITDYVKGMSWEGLKEKYRVTAPAIRYHLMKSKTPMRGRANG